MLRYFADKFRVSSVSVPQLFTRPHINTAQNTANYKATYRPQQQKLFTFVSYACSSAVGLRTKEHNCVREGGRHASTEGRGEESKYVCGGRR